ncbi:TPA: hypothetical protein ACJFTY_004597 [Escherichia coli]|uniref:hypothetical protein n=1 Tax=Escherichia coli TaxID=562 RepID=UPI0038565377
MRALLTPEIAPRMGIVLFRPGSELMPLFMQGRVLLEPEPERYSSFASGAVPAASQPLADDPAVRAVFHNEAVIRRAGGVECLESWLLREKGCQWPHSDWHSENMTTMRHAPGAIRLCWHCDNQLRDQFTERLESMATDNCARWVLSVVRRDLGFDDSGVYDADISGASTLILHFNMNAGSCPAVQFRVNYRNGGIFYRSARDGYGFEANWSEFYTTTRKPSAGDVGAYTQAECNSRFITGIRLGGLSSVQTWKGPGWSDRSGYVVTGSVNGNRDELIDTTQARPIQYCINGTWYNAGSI